MRADITRAMGALSNRQQRECMKRSRNLENLSNYLRQDETVRFVAPSYWGVGIFAITTQRLLFVGSDSVNIPLADIYSAEVKYEPVTNNIFASGQDVLKIRMRGGQSEFRLKGDCADAARDVLQATLMR